MRRNYWIFIFFLLFTWATTVYGAKFGDSFQQDSLTQNNQQNLKNAPINIQPASKTLGIQQPATAEPLLATASNPIIAQSVSTSAPSQITGQDSTMPASFQITSPITKMDEPIMSSTGMAGLAIKKEIKISVPNIEEKYKQMLRAQEAQEAQKTPKRSLLDSIMEEIMRYGMLIILALVVLTVVYVLRKEKDVVPHIDPDKKNEKTSDSQKSKQEPKKDIWSEDF